MKSHLLAVSVLLLSWSVASYAQETSAVDSLVLHARRAHRDNRFGEAIDMLQEAIRLGDSWEARWVLANTYNEVGRHEEAIALADSVIQSYRHDAYAYHRRGWFRFEVGQWNEAVADFTISIELDSTYSYAYNTRGCAYLMLGDTLRANSDFRRVIEIETEPHHDACKQFAYYRLGYSDKAIDWMNRVLAIDDSYYDAACLYSLMGDTDRALHYLQLALDNGFRRYVHILSDPDLANLRNSPAFDPIRQLISANR